MLLCQPVYDRVFSDEEITLPSLSLLHTSHLSHLSLRPRARGFTLLELLVVIGIIMLFLSISIGAIMRTPKMNALVGTEHVVADIIRQARHSARSSGAPVIVEVHKDDRVIQGVSQVPLFYSGFEKVIPSSNDALAVPADYSATGFSGKGIRVGSNGKLLLDYPATARNQDLSKNRGSRVQGFYLSCSVKAIAGAVRNPLAQIGSADQDATTCGLALHAVSRKIQFAPGNTAAVPPKPDQNPSYITYDIYGWIRTGTGDLEIIDAIQDSVAVQQPMLVTERDIAQPMAGGKWEEVGILFDGEALELYRDGVLIAQRNSSTATPLTPPSALAAGDNRIYCGRGIFSDGPDAPPGVVYLSGVLDDVRLMRLGVDRAHTLPSGVSPKDDYRLSIQPDGRVKNHQIGTTVNPPWIFQLTSGDSAEITIAIDGSVTSRSLVAGSP